MTFPLWVVALNAGLLVCCGITLAALDRGLNSWKAAALESERKYQDALDAWAKVVVQHPTVVQYPTADPCACGHGRERHGEGLLVGCNGIHDGRDCPCTFFHEASQPPAYDIDAAVAAFARMEAYGRLRQ